MCGIAGFVGPPDDAALAAMRDALRHRGPDGAGSFSADGVSLGHRRLAIVDVAGGAQPAFNEDRSVVVVFNGEIYNHPELRPRLEAAGHRFGSAADTESILHAYEEWGPACVERLHGMFAFVLFDRRRRRLFAARDRAGEKPLHYVADPGGAVPFAFASEPKALAAHPALRGAFGLSERGLISYLARDCTAGAETIFAGVRRLPPGHALTFGLPDSAEPGLKVRRYWEPRFGAAPPSDPAELLDRLRGAVRRQLMSDVPLGVFLSGGIDSTALVRLLCDLRPAESIDTFSIGFDDPSFDETPFSALAAERLGTRRHHRNFAAETLLAALPEVAGRMDEPFADPSLFPVSLLSAFAREHVKVALGGDGGDELFAGYDPFRALAAGRWYGRLVPAALHRLLMLPAARLLPVSDRNLGFAFKAARFLRGAAEPAATRLAAWMGPFDLPGLRRLMPDLAHRLRREDVYAAELDAADQLERTGQTGDLVQALDWFQRFYLSDDILTKVDRASMLHSLEVRCPFLDAEFMEYANGLAPEEKLRGSLTKVALRRALAGPPPLVPKEILSRGKKGFGMPVARWLRNELRPLFEEAVVEELPRHMPMLDRGEIARLWRCHLDRREHLGKELWALLMLALWRRGPLGAGG